jgi:gamma-glutamyltranspeptidase/glutathione hydrolase/leukotriene-C4 hydrolase
VSVVDKNNQAVAVTSTVNLVFGAKIMTPQGIILNNEMDDFSSPGITNAFGYQPAPANFIAPYKRPLSSSTPTVVADRFGEVRCFVFQHGFCHQP